MARSLALRLAGELLDAAEVKVLLLRSVKTCTVWQKQQSFLALPLLILSSLILRGLYGSYYSISRYRNIGIVAHVGLVNHHHRARPFLHWQKSQNGRGA